MTILPPCMQLHFDSIDNNIAIKQFYKHDIALSVVTTTLELAKKRRYVAPRKFCLAIAQMSIKGFTYQDSKETLT